MARLLNTIAITLDGDNAANDVLQAPHPATNGAYQRYEFTVNGLDGDDKLFGSKGPWNWARHALLHPTEPLEVVNYLNGGAGNDMLYSTVGLANLDPTITANYWLRDVLNGGEGNDIYVLRSQTATIVETNGTGGGIDTVVLTANGLATSGGVFSLETVASVENIRVQTAALYSHIQIIGNSENNTIWDNASDGDLYGGDGADTLYGLAGNDHLSGGNGSDLLRGGLGNDFIYAGDGDDKLIGDAGDDILSGGLGNDFLNGSAGADILLGDSGNDTLVGGPGIDSLYGGSGDDLYSVDSALDQVMEVANGGFDTVASAEISLDASDYFDVEALKLVGLLDLDLTGNATGMTLAGNDGANHIYGGAGNDLMDGGAGNDSLYGGLGNDALTGGDGSDTFVFVPSALTGTGTPEVYITTLTDFDSGVDLIDLSGPGWITIFPDLYVDFVNNVQLQISEFSFTVFNFDTQVTLTVNSAESLTLSDFVLV